MNGGFQSLASPAMHSSTQTASANLSLFIITTINADNHLEQVSPARALLMATSPDNSSKGVHYHPPFKGKSNAGPGIVGGGGEVLDRYGISIKHRTTRSNHRPHPQQSCFAPIPSSSALVNIGNGLIMSRN